MLIELEKDNTNTLPHSVIESMGLMPGDKFELSVCNGILRMEPVAVFDREYINELEQAIIETKKDIESGTKQLYECPSDMFNELNK